MDDVLWDRLAVGRRVMGQVGCGTTCYGTGWLWDDVAWENLAVGRRGME